MDSWSAWKLAVGPGCLYRARGENVAPEPAEKRATAARRGCSSHMMRASAWLVLTTLAACGSDGEPGNRAKESGAPAKAVQTATPVGLFESDSPVGASQICFQRDGADYRFGLTLRGADNLSCSGSGRAVQA